MFIKQIPTRKLKKVREVKKDLIEQQVKKILSDGDQKLILMVRG